MRIKIVDESIYDNGNIRMRMAVRINKAVPYVY